MVTNQEKIAELKKELASYDEKDEENEKMRKETQEIKELQKQIKAKKYGDLKRVGSNLKAIGKNIGKISTEIGKGMEKFIGEGEKGKTKGNVKSFEDTLKDLPQ
jgi:chromosome segregation ATPase